MSGVQFCYAWSVVTSFPPPSFLHKDSLVPKSCFDISTNLAIVVDMKLIIAAIYSNYTTHIVDDEGIEPTDAYTGHPKSNSLYLRFERAAED